jgi:hypothetical protein
MAPIIETAKMEDTADIADIFMRCFNDEYFQALFPPMDAGRDYIKRRYNGFIHSRERGSQEASVWLIRDQGGKNTSIYSTRNTETDIRVG